MPKGENQVLYKLKQLVLLLLCFVMCRCAFFVPSLFSTLAHALALC